MGDYKEAPSKSHEKFFSRKTDTVVDLSNQVMMVSSGTISRFLLLLGILGLANSAPILTKPEENSKQSIIWCSWFLPLRSSCASEGRHQSRY